MNFVIAIVMFIIFAAIEAKHKSDSTDVSSGDSQQELTDNDATSDEASDYPDDLTPGKSRDHHHKHSKDGLGRNQLETRRWHKSCLRKASKRCSKACERAYKAVCKKRKCSKRSKKTLKKECKKSCTKNFEFDKDRAAYEE